MILRRMVGFCLLVLTVCGLVLGCAGSNDSGNSSREDSDELIYAWHSAYADSDSVVVFDVGVMGCMCAEYDYFLIGWSEFDDQFVCIDELINVLRLADQDGILLCDCRKSDSDSLESVIDSIDELTGHPGLKVNLIREIYLDGDEIIPRMRSLFRDNEDFIVFEASQRVRYNTGFGPSI